MNGFIRYVLAELLKTFLMALLAFTGIFLLYGVAQEARQQDVAPLIILRMMPYLTLEALRFGMPCTALLSVTLVYGRLASANEIIALKSLGISPLRVLMPTFIAAVGLSLVCCWINDLAVSWGQVRIQQVALEAIEDIVYARLHEQHSFSNGNFTLTVAEVDGRKLIRPHVDFQGGADTPPISISAEEAELKFDPKKQQLTFAIYRGTASGANVEYYFDYEERSAEFERKRRFDRTASNIPLSELHAEKLQTEQEIVDYREALAVTLGYDLLTGNTPALPYDEWRKRLIGIKIRQQHISRLEAEPWRRWATGFSVLFFVMVGAPVAILFKHSDLMTNFFRCFGPILAGYYPVFAITMGLAKDGDLHGVFMWTANVIAGALAIPLVYRVWRY